MLLHPVTFLTVVLPTEAKADTLPCSLCSKRFLFSYRNPKQNLITMSITSPWNNAPILSSHNLVVRLQKRVWSNCRWPHGICHTAFHFMVWLFPLFTTYDKRLGNLGKWLACDDSKFCKRRFRLDIRKNLFTERVV